MTRLEMLHIKIISDRYQGKWLNTVDPHELILESMAEFIKLHSTVASKAWMKILWTASKTPAGRFATIKVLKREEQCQTQKPTESKPLLKENSSS